MGTKMALATRPLCMANILLAALFALFVFPYDVAAAGPEIGLGGSQGLTRRAMPDTDSLSVLNLFGQAVVDDHTCAKGRPCLNGACCGASGACGYGPAYCGIGCTSNCDAVAECGQFSDNGAVICPLNVCCSEFGFCGTTSEFCDPGSGCQSNCGNPSSPGSGGNVRSRVIGYYESWSSNSGRCGALKPSQIPASALDILNFAFAYIDPHTLDIIPMVGEDGSSLSQAAEAELYTAVTAAKMTNPNLGVWLAIGGWTFSDNNTIFQPVLGHIASDPTMRQEFSMKLVKFMNQYGFDGVDIDWEYPGAPDRGGTEADIDNFPLLLQDIRTAFNIYNHGRWGISITAPSSYWYLRWFNLPELVKHINFINLMSYDLHGIWDQENEIGNQILAHTNLTEVDEALQLFWRSEIDPAMINLGVAFYGRSYTLSDASCSKPGCAFSGPGRAGECSDTEGYLSYREIMSLIDEKGDSVDQMWDKEAGVKMLVYNDNNWISYDDSTTFQQKVDFANERGLAGLMIWAIDQDDDSFNALQSLTNRHVDPLVKESDLEDDFDVSRCVYTECGDSCPTGFKTMTKLNLNKRGEGCPGSGKDSTQRSFCCPPWGAPDPKTCHWTKNCGGNCNDGEATLALDNFGGGGYCSNSPKSFCCPASNIERSIQACSWYTLRSNCPAEKPQKLTEDLFRIYCCPAQPVFDTNTCDWYGSQLFCTNANCPVGKITVAQTSSGTPDKEGKNINDGCYFGGAKSFCCDSPFGEKGAGTLPVSLDHLFPEYEEIPTSDEATYKEAAMKLQDPFGDEDDLNTTPFAWVIMVGPPDSVQSLDKRDGSSLETFDCPNPASDDYSVQTLKAVCMAESDDNDCEDLLLGDGAYGTIARLPASCGPDEWVRVVDFRPIQNDTLPPHLVKRATSRSQVYEIKYDYRIRDVTSDEIFVRIDSSTHERYWDTVVASDLQSKKRSQVSDWREPHMEWFRQHEQRKRGAGDLTWWKDQFATLLRNGAVDSYESAEYKFDQTLYQASISCPPNFDASMSARVEGGMVAHLDWGVSLIGRVKDTKFEQAYAYFSLEEIEVNAQIYLEGEAQFTFESREVHLLSNFAPWGGNFNIKGLVTIGPFMDVTAQIDAIATLSGSFSSGVTIGNSIPPLRWMYPASMDMLPYSGDLVSGMYSEDTTIEASREVLVAAQGSVALTVTPSVAFKVQIDINGLLQTNTHITAAFPNRMIIGVNTADTCDNGLEYWMDYEQHFNIITNTSSLGWNVDPWNIYSAKKRLLPPKCYTFNSVEPRDMKDATLTTPLIRMRDDGDDGSGPAVDPLFPDPTGSCLVCARNTYFEDSPCGRLFDDDGFEIDPECTGNGASSSTKRAAANAESEPLRPEYESNLQWFKERALIEKRSTKDPFSICNRMINVAKLNFPSSGDLINSGGTYVTYAPTSAADPENYEFGVRPMPAPADSKKYNAEHVLEHQTLKSFLEAYTKFQDKQYDDSDFANCASDAMKDSIKALWIDQDDWDFCSYFKFWLDFIPLTANWYDGKEYSGSSGALSQTIMKALPNNDKYYEEMMLLDGDTNSIKEAAWNDGVEDVRRVESCLAKSPPDYSKALCSMGKAIYAIRYHQLVQDTLVKQAKRVVTFLDGMEDAAAAVTSPKIVTCGYVRLGISKYFKKWMYNHAATAGLKLAGLLNENIRTMQKDLEPEDVEMGDGASTAGGGTTTGATQQNDQLLDQLKALENQYAGQGAWSYEGWPNPFKDWADEPDMVYQ